MVKRLLGWGILLLLMTGCAWFQTSEEQTADQLTNDGMYYYEDGRYRKAIEAFEKLKDWYPFSKYASLAELKIGDAHYRVGDYAEAIAAYEAFEALHPKNEAIPYVIYQIGTCYFEQMGTVDRDQTAAQRAIETYRRLIAQFPDGDYAVKARDRIKICQKNLAGHEFYIGIFYYKSKDYKPALQRFKAVLSNYPDVGIHQDALRYAALCEKELKAKEPADKN